MIPWLLLTVFGQKKFIPDFHEKSIFDVDYDKLYEEGCRIILTDLDNTLISYTEDRPNEKLINWKNDLINKGFKIMIVSNSHSSRVTNFASEIDLPCQFGSLKPLKKGIKKALKRLDNPDKKTVYIMGDQILTDILGGNRVGINTILIEAIDRTTERKSTRFNRFFEARVVKKLKKKNPTGVLKNYE